MSIEQAAYQVRLRWGQAGLAIVAADADVIVWVDVLGDAQPATWPPHADVLAAGFPTALTAAAWVVDHQRRAERRLTIAVVAAGRPDRDGSYAVEDHLAAGAFIAALGEHGIDATSPDAAVAEAAYRALGAAVGHLVSASTAGRAAGVEPSVHRGPNKTGDGAVRIIQAAAPRPGA